MTKPTTHRWYENSVFYQILVGVFNDTTGEGIGTLKGVEEKLDYLQWLGIDCIWLSPFYASPLRDDGYDIADYRAIHPDYGTMEDFDDLIEAIHARGMKLITDLALNHTSMDHRWFQESRKDPHGPYGDYYVWGDDPNRYPEIRIIFTDTESSNWSFDEVRGQYYFHRFYKEQPDLNYDSPAVHKEVLSLIDFWMDKGLDGFRLDAIPYLYERDGAGGESLPETLEFIEKLRAHVDEHYPDAFMIAEANQPPAETREYFGNGDRVHMVFNFPLMPRLYQAVATSQASPIIEIMPDLLHLPPGTQWGNFLRNHDELTLEMVSGPERELMYSAYLPDDSMRAHLG
ncbi:alpha-amylase family glycosyl hydrolase, partial [Corynebacterium casei]